MEVTSVHRSITETYQDDFFKYAKQKDLALMQKVFRQIPILNPFEPPRLTYWLREAKSANAEVDYATANGNQVIPIEVKAGKSGALKSLQQFALNKNAALCVRFDLNPPDIGQITHAARVNGGSVPVPYTLLSLPLYLVEEISRILDEIRMQK